MQIPARQIAYVRRHTGDNTYDSDVPGTPFRCYGWAVARTDDATNDSVPASWVELYAPRDIVHAATGAPLDPIGALDRIVLPVDGPLNEGSPEVPGHWEGGTEGHYEGGTAEKQRLTIDYGNTLPRFKLTYSGQQTTEINSNQTSSAVATAIAAALNALTNLDGVTVASGPYIDGYMPTYDVTFGGANLGINVPLLTAQITSTGDPYASVTAATTVQPVAGTWVPGVPSTWVPTVPAVPAGPTTLWVEHFVQGMRQDANNGLTEWKPGATLQLLRV